MDSSSGTVSRWEFGLVVALLSGWAWAGGSNYGVTPGSLPVVTGKVSEWPVPTPQFARDPAPGPDGNLYIAVMRGNRIARFEPSNQSFTEWELPRGASPHGLVVDGEGIVWYTGNGNGTIGRLDPRSGKVTEFKTPSGGDPHTAVLDAKGDLWFTVQNGQRVGRLERASSRIVEYPMKGNPYGLAIDKQGIVWVCRMFGDALGWIDPATGKIGEVPTGEGSRPRRIATAPDGSLWVAFYGNGKLAKLDPAAKRIAKTWDMPPGGGKDPYAVTVDAVGRVWVNGIDTDTVSLFDPRQENFRVIALPSKNVGIRKAIIDAQGRYWYMGSHNGRLGMIE
jgi:virginiamycin B lyase